jgi:O-antigen/teichoic acid export membrane protein
MLSLPLTLLATILLARSLGPEGFGQYTFVIALITTLSIPLAPALMQLATRETAGLHQAGEDRRIRALLHWGNRFVLLGSIMVIAVVGSLALWFADWRVDDRWTMLLVGLIALPLLGLNAVRAGVLAGLRRVVQGQFPELFVRPFVLVLVAGTLLILGALTPLSAVFAFLVAAGAAFFVGVLLLNRMFPDSEKSLLTNDSAQNRQWLRAWMPFTLLVAVSTLNTQLGILLLGWLSTDDQVAAMQIAQRGAILVALSLSVVDSVINPHIARLYRQNDMRKLQMLAQRAAQVVLLMSLPIALPLIFFGAPIISFFFGEEYSSLVRDPLAILVIGQLLNMFFGSVGMLLVMSGHERETMNGLLLALMINVLLALFLIPFMGADGAAISSAIGLVACNVFLLSRVFKKLGIAPMAIRLRLHPQGNY